MLTTRSRSGNSNRCGVSASRSRGPISSSVLMIPNTWSMTSRNSLDDENLLTGLTLTGRRPARGGRSRGGGHPCRGLGQRNGEPRSNTPSRRCSWMVSRTCSESSSTRRRSPAASGPYPAVSIGSQNSIRQREGNGTAPSGRSAGAQRDLGESPASEALQAVTLGPALPDPPLALGKDCDEVVLLEQADRVVRRRDGTPELAHGDRQPREVERPLEDEKAREARQRVLAQDRRGDHERVPGEDACMVGHEQGTPVTRHVRHPDRPRSPPTLVEQLEQWVDGLGEAFVEAPLVLGEVALEAAEPRLEHLPQLLREADGGGADGLERARAPREPPAQAAEKQDYGAERKGGGALLGGHGARIPGGRTAGTSAGARAAGLGAGVRAPRARPPPTGVACGAQRPGRSSPTVEAMRRPPRLRTQSSTASGVE